MSALTGIGALLQGLTNETKSIRQEREAKAQRNMSMSVDMFKYIIESPLITNPVLKQEATEGLRDVYMQHFFPENYKSKPGKLHKMVEQFVGSNSSGGVDPEAVKKAFGEGGGRGNNGKSTVGGLPPSPAENAVESAGAQATEGAGPIPPMPSPQASAQAQPSGPPQMPTGTSAGFLSPQEQQTVEIQKAVAMQTALAAATQKSKEAEKAAAIKYLQTAPELDEFRKSGMLEEVTQHILTGASAPGSARGVEGQPMPVEAARKRWPDAQIEDGGTGIVQVTTNPRTGAFISSAPALDPRSNIGIRNEDVLKADAEARGIPLASYLTDPQYADFRTSARNRNEITVSQARQFGRSVDETGKPIFVTGTEMARGTLDKRDHLGALQTLYDSSGTPWTAGIPNLSTTQLATTPTAFVTNLSAEASSLERIIEITDGLQKIDPARLGPITGRFTEWTLPILRGAGLTAQEADLMLKLKAGIAEQIFSKGGKVLTATELEIYGGYFPGFSQSGPYAVMAAIQMATLIKRDMGNQLTALDPKFKNNVNEKFWKMAGLTKPTNTKTNAIEPTAAPTPERKVNRVPWPGGD